MAFFFILLHLLGWHWLTQLCTGFRCIIPEHIICTLYYVFASPSQVSFHCGFNLHVTMANNGEQLLFMCLLAICISSSAKYLCSFSNLFIFLKNPLCILNTRLLSDICSLKCVACPFILFNKMFTKTQVFNLIL